MSTSSGPNVATSSLILEYDAFNSKSRLGPNLINASTSISTYAVNQNVTITQSGQYIQAVCNQNTSTPGVYPIGGTLSCSPYTQYTFRVRGVVTVGSAPFLYVNGNVTSNMVWTGNPITTTLGWVENTFTTGADTSLTVGILWSGPVTGSTILIEDSGLHKTGAWYDLAGGSHLAMTGSPSFTTLGGASCYRFTATPPTTDMTIETWIYPESEVQADDRGCLLLLNGASSGYMSWNKSSLQMSNYWYGHPSEGYWETGAAVSRNTWNSFTSVWNNSTSSVYQWTNNVKTIGSSTVGNASTGTGILVGQESGGRQFAGGIALMRVYNRALSDTEVKQNFNALRGRFGI